MKDGEYGSKGHDKVPCFKEKKKNAILKLSASGKEERNNGKFVVYSFYTNIVVEKKESKTWWLENNENPPFDLMVWVW